jgi:hypothetical protein
MKKKKKKKWKMNDETSRTIRIKQKLKGESVER